MSVPYLRCHRVRQNLGRGKRYPREQDIWFRSTGASTGNPGPNAGLAVNLRSPDGGPAVVQGATVEARGPAASLETGGKTGTGGATATGARPKAGAPRQLRKSCEWRDHSTVDTGDGGTAESGGATVLGGSPATAAPPAGRPETGGTAQLPATGATSETGGMVGTGGSVGSGWRRLHGRQRLSRLAWRRSIGAGGGPGRRWCSQYGPARSWRKRRRGGTTDPAPGRPSAVPNPQVKQRISCRTPRAGQATSYPGFACSRFMLGARLRRKR